jgi:hypothetical protein
VNSFCGHQNEPGAWKGFANLIPGNNLPEIFRGGIVVFAVFDLDQTFLEEDNTSSQYWKGIDKPRGEVIR